MEKALESAEGRAMVLHSNISEQMLPLTYDNSWLPSSESSSPDAVTPWSQLGSIKFGKPGYSRVGCQVV